MSKNHLMSRGLGLIIIVICLGGFIASAVGAEFTADLVQKTTMGEFTGKVYVKGKNIRREMTMMGQKQVMITKSDKRATYILMPQQMSYMEMKWSKQDEAMNSSIEDLKKEGKVKYLGKEKVSGHTCKKYKYIPDDPNGTPVIFWVSNKLDYPIKIEAITPQGKMIMLYKNIKQKKISDSLFNIPSDYEKISLPTMMQGMGSQ